MAEAILNNEIPDKIGNEINSRPMTYADKNITSISSHMQYRLIKF